MVSETLLAFYFACSGHKRAIYQYTIMMRIEVTKTHREQDHDGNEKGDSEEGEEEREWEGI